MSGKLTHSNPGTLPGKPGDERWVSHKDAYNYIVALLSKKFQKMGKDFQNEI